MGSYHHCITRATINEHYKAEGKVQDQLAMQVNYALRPALKPPAALQGHKSQILCLTFSPDATKMVTASKDGTWRVWNIDVRYHQQEDAKCLLQHKQEASGLSVHPVCLAAFTLHVLLYSLSGRSSLHDFFICKCCKVQETTV